MAWISRLVAINCRASSDGSGRCLCRAMPPRLHRNWGKVGDGAAPLARNKRLLTAVLARGNIPCSSRPKPASGRRIGLCEV